MSPIEQQKSTLLTHTHKSLIMISFCMTTSIKTSTLRFHGNLTRGVNSRPIADSFVLSMIRRNYFPLCNGEDAHPALALL